MLTNKQNALAQASQVIPHLDKTVIHKHIAIQSNDDTLAVGC